MADRETELMLRVAAGDDAVFQDLVGLVLPRLLGFFRRLGADPTTAEDCAQETFMKVYRARAGYVARARFTTYLFHIARNHWIDVVRHRKVRPRMWSTDQGPRGADGEVQSTQIDGEVRQPAEHLGDSELGCALEAAVDALAPGHKEVFVLAQVEGLRYQEIGEILGIPVGTVKSRMHTAVRELRGSLRARGLEP